MRSGGGTSLREALRLRQRAQEGQRCEYVVVRRSGAFRVLRGGFSAFSRAIARGWR